MTTVYFHMHKALESRHKASTLCPVVVQDGVPVRALKVLSEKAAQMLQFGFDSEIPQLNHLIIS